MKQTEFGYRVRQALNESLERLDYKTTYRLAEARKAALARQRQPQESAEIAWTPALQGAGGAIDQGPSGSWSWLQRAGLLAPLLVLLIGFVAIYEWRADSAVNEIADIDFAVLLDEAPLQTYADPGFGVVLRSGSVD